MATAAYTMLYEAARVKVVKWTLTDANPDGQPFTFAGRLADKSFQVYGTFGTGGTVKCQGTNEVTTPTNWFNLADPQGTEISIAATAKIEAVLENTYQIRPYLSAGTGVTLTVLLCLKG